MRGIRSHINARSRGARGISLSECGTTSSLTYIYNEAAGYGCMIGVLLIPGAYRSIEGVLTVRLQCNVRVHRCPLGR